MRSALILGLPLLLLASACTYDNGRVHRVDSTGAAGASGTIDTSGCSDSTTPVQSAIDVDRKIEVDEGVGAGVFIEYSTGGHWLVRTSCDTLTSNLGCAWDVIVTPQDGSTLDNLLATDLEPGDVAERYSDQLSYQLRANTSADLDSFSFDSDPGAAIRIDAYLDDTCAVPYFFWVGDGALHSGSPTNPLDLIPSAN